MSNSSAVNAQQYLADRSVARTQVRRTHWLSSLCLSALNRGAADYPDLTLDGRIGSATLDALDGFLARRGRGAEVVLLKAVEALQGERYLQLAERRPANEAFLYGWLANRLG